MHALLAGTMPQGMPQHGPLGAPSGGPLVGAAGRALSSRGRRGQPTGGHQGGGPQGARGFGWAAPSEATGGEPRAVLKPTPGYAELQQAIARAEGEAPGREGRCHIRIEKSEEPV